VCTKKGVRYILNSLAIAKLFRQAGLIVNALSKKRKRKGILGRADELLVYITLLLDNRILAIIACNNKK
jgi:hypothetical protein